MFFISCWFCVMLISKFYLNLCRYGINGPPTVAERVLWIWVYLPFHSSVLLSGSFLGISHIMLCMTESDFRKKIVPKMVKMGQKEGFLNLLENIVINFFWIWPLKKVYINWCILAQIPCLGKICFLRYGLKCSASVRLQDF